MAIKAKQKGKILETHSKEDEINDIDFEIKMRLRWHYFDALFAFLLSWGAIIVSLISIYLLYIENKNWALFSVVFSTFLLICDKTFNFGSRSEWGRIYLTELELLKNDLIHDKIDAYTAYKKRADLRKVNPLNITHHDKYTKI